MTKSKDGKDLIVKAKEMLAERIGVEPDDISNEDTFLDSLHMSPAELSDFVDTLKVLEIDTSQFDITEIISFNDLVEQISSKELIE